jgi:hypothetical protein
MMAKKAQRPIDVQDMPWSHMGKDALDAAAERLWNEVRGVNPVNTDPFDQDFGPYHVQLSETQYAAQKAVLVVLGHAVPALLRQRAKELKSDGVTADEVYYLLDLADELESDHGGE